MGGKCGPGVFLICRADLNFSTSLGHAAARVARATMRVGSNLLRKYFDVVSAFFLHIYLDLPDGVRQLSLALFCCLLLCLALYLVL